MVKKYDVVIIGGGFTGLTAAYVLAKEGYSICVLESDLSPGGLAGVFEFSDGIKLEKFYHHWFNNDKYVPELVNELNLNDHIIKLPTQTGMYFNGRIWRLSTPLDLLRFTALSVLERFRLGYMVLQVRRIKNWKLIEGLTIREWLEPLCGKRVYQVVWEPLVNAKFSIFAESINAVWMWKKLVLRGSTRNSKGGEELMYFKGGFGRLANNIASSIEKYGGSINYGKKVIGVDIKGDNIESVVTDTEESITGNQFLFTPAFPIIARIFEDSNNPEWISRLNRVNYLGNMCLVLRLSKSLSGTYWLNVNDPSFPFVGVIEHTNFDSTDNYSGSHIVYLSRYLAVEDPVWLYSDEQYFNYAVLNLKRMFPEMDESWVVDYRVWRAEYAQPVTECGYSSYVPTNETPFNNLLISTMAQIYPEDRGTNYAIREGRIAADILIERLRSNKRQIDN